MNYAPTDCLSIDGKLIVADGYGSSFVHEVSAANGQYTGMSYGGKGRAGSATAPVRFDCGPFLRRMSSYCTEGCMRERLRHFPLAALRLRPRLFGLGLIVALCYLSSTTYHICEHIRCLSV
jgi:hypothetical protein